MSSVIDPLPMPEDVWQRGDVGDALDRRDIGGLFRRRPGPRRPPHRRVLRASPVSFRRSRPARPHAP